MVPFTATKCQEGEEDFLKNNFFRLRNDLHRLRSVYGFGKV